ncbi:MAG: MgtC/SapB family protein [Gallicola sp.]|nr:MgtC/SapB family protein [Gallicola sp.]
MYSLSQNEIIVRIVASILVGVLIGYEREMKGHPAGLRTHILVCVGACLLSLIQVNAAYQTILLANDPEAAKVLSVDMTRLTAQIVNGIGFLGAGTIILTKNKIKGLTSAASIWTTAAIGIAMGMGYYFMGFISCIIIFLSLLLMKRIVQYPLIYSFTVVYKDQDHLIDKMESYMTLNKAMIINKRYSYDLKEGVLLHKNHYKVDLRKVSSITVFFSQLFKLGIIDSIDSNDFETDAND